MKTSFLCASLLLALSSTAFAAAPKLGTDCSPSKLASVGAAGVAKSVAKSALGTAASVAMAQSRDAVAKRVPSQKLGELKLSKQSAAAAMSSSRSAELCADLHPFHALGLIASAAKE